VLVTGVEARPLQDLGAVREPGLDLDDLPAPPLGAGDYLRRQGIQQPERLQHRPCLAAVQGEVRRRHQVTGQHHLLGAVVAAQLDAGAGDPDNLVLASVEGDPVPDAEHRLPAALDDTDSSVVAAAGTDEVAVVVTIVSSASGRVRSARKTPH
jgi:hypothetical protein